MNLDEYQQLAKRTARHPDPNADMYELMALGLIGETGEVVDLIKKHKFHGVRMDVEKLKKEVGDCLWYLANGLTLEGVTLFAPSSTCHGYAIPLATMAAEIGTIWIEGGYKTNISVDCYLSDLTGIAKQHGFTLEDAAAANIEKLQRRYPDGFDLDKARNHDSE